MERYFSAPSQRPAPLTLPQAAAFAAASYSYEDFIAAFERVLAVLPTMRVPGDVGWHRDLAYNATWALLAEVARWNAEKDEGIGRVLMTGLGTGAGGVGVERCARQMVLAVQHYARPLPASVRWADVEGRMADVRATVDG